MTHQTRSFGMTITPPSGPKIKRKNFQQGTRKGVDNEPSQKNRQQTKHAPTNKQRQTKEKQKPPLKQLKGTNETPAAKPPFEALTPNFSQDLIFIRDGRPIIQNFQLISIQSLEIFCISEKGSSTFFLPTSSSSANRIPLRHFQIYHRVITYIAKNTLPPSAINRPLN